MSVQCILFQFGDDPCNNRYQDPDGQLAFTVASAGFHPNPVFKLTRIADWAERYPSMGPTNAYFYFGPLSTPGYLVYGNNQNRLRMTYMLRQRREGSPSRYFTSQNGKDYKWRIEPERMELWDGRTSLALWELSDPEEDFHARLTIRPPGIPIATEIVTTLALNRMSQMFLWENPTQDPFS